MSTTSNSFSWTRFTASRPSLAMVTTKTASSRISLANNWLISLSSTKRIWAPWIGFNFFSILSSGAGGWISSEVSRLNVLIMVSKRVEGLNGLIRNPSTPTWSAWRAISSRPKAVTIRMIGIPTRSGRFLICLEASIPLMSGIFQSINTKS